MFYIEYHICPQFDRYLLRLINRHKVEYPMVKILKKLIGITARAILFFRMPDSRSGVKGRTIRKRMGKFYK
jgi:hypothetical protein